MSFLIDARLHRDCHVLGKLDDTFVLLLDNALYPWFILVPETTATEFHNVEAAQQQRLLTQINQMSRYIESHFQVSKLNTACIGNIVRQLHIHVIGRREDDPCWPGVVWGTQQSLAYQPDKVSQIQISLSSFVGEQFVSLENVSSGET